MNRVDNYIDMLKEFYYKKNGKELTIEFLMLMVNLMEQTDDEEWK